MIGRLERFLLQGAALVLLVTGAAYAWMKYVMPSEDPFSVVGHPAQPYLLWLHVLAGPVFVFAVGVIAREHLIGRYRDPRVRRSGRRSGVASAAILVLAVASGYLLQVVTAERPRGILALVHLGSGVLFAAIYAAHLAFSNGRNHARGRVAGGLKVVAGRSGTGARRRRV